MGAIPKEEQKINFINLLIVVLSVYVLIALLIDTFFKLPDEISRVLNTIDDAICIIFLYDFCLRYYRSKSKIQFMKWGWIDLISSIPTFNMLRAGRLFRLVRLFRILRAFRSVKVIIHHIFRNKIQGTFTAVAIISILVLIFSSIAILTFETAPNSNIKTAEDALWWSFETLTTIGYGDVYPVTSEGRMVAVVLMTVGVGMFGTFTAYLASWFVTSTKANEQDKDNNMVNIDIERN